MTRHHDRRDDRPTAVATAIQVTVRPFAHGPVSAAGALSWRECSGSSAGAGTFSMVLLDVLLELPVGTEDGTRWQPGAVRFERHVVLGVAHQNTRG